LPSPVQTTAAKTSPKLCRQPQVSDKPAQAPDLGQRPAEKPVEKPDATKSAQQRLDQNKLEENLKSEDVPKEVIQRIRENMKKFEERAAKDHLSPDEVTKIYEQVNRLLDSRDDKIISRADKQILADQIMQHSADPGHLDQGYHATCGPTSLEARLFKTHPSEAAKLIADVGTTGQYKGKDGTTVSMTTNDLKKDGEAMTNPPEDNERSYASKLFQETALNLHYQDLRQRYVETPGATPGDRRTYGKPDKEQVVDSHNHKLKGNHLPTLGDLSDIEKKITGKRDADHYLCHKSVAGDEAKNGKIKSFKNEKEFAQALHDAKASGKLPLTLWVDTRKSPFKSETGGGEGGGHFVTVTDYDEKTGKVHVQNQWGYKNNHTGDRALPLHKLYEATQ
jgi:hypothetical protein